MAKDITGNTYGRLTAIKYTGNNDSHGNRIWELQCSCGKKHSTTVAALNSGNTKSCGCHKMEMLLTRSVTHGLSRSESTSKVYSAWTDIKRKCYNPEAKEYCRYGARGRTIQDSWYDNPTAFVDYMLSLPGFSKEMTVERIDNTKGYCEGNLRWATSKEQAQNRAMYSTNTSGKVGVRFRVVDGNTYASAFWNQQEDCKPRSKTFSVTKLGLLPAWKAACEFRDNVINDLNSQGAVYSENHGKEFKHETTN